MFSAGFLLVGFPCPMHLRRPVPENSATVVVLGEARAGDVLLDPFHMALVESTPWVLTTTTRYAC